MTYDIEVSAIEAQPIVGIRATSRRGRWEVYWTDPGEVPARAEWKTEVCWPLSGAAD